jgi:SOS-response transcriptional repressor LexA
VENQKKEEKIRAIGERIRIVREILGYRRQGDFGRDMGGLTIDQVSRAERGDNFPPIEFLVGLAKKSINVNFILTGEGPVDTTPLVRLSSPLNPSELHDLAADMTALHERFEKLAGLSTPMPPEHEVRLQKARIEGAPRQVPVYRVGRTIRPGYRTIPAEDLDGVDWKGKAVPLINQIAAGRGIDTAEADSYAPDAASSFVEYVGAPAGAFAVQVTGDSMEPEYRDRDVVIVDPSDTVDSGLACVVLEIGGSRCPRLKRVRRRGKTVILESANPKYPPETVGISRVSGFFRVWKHLPEFVEEKGP